MSNRKYCKIKLIEIAGSEWLSLEEILEKGIMNFGDDAGIGLHPEGLLLKPCQLMK